MNRLSNIPCIVKLLEKLPNYLFIIVAQALANEREEPFSVTSLLIFLDACNRSTECIHL